MISKLQLTSNFAYLSPIQAADRYNIHSQLEHCKFVVCYVFHTCGITYTFDLAMGKVVLRNYNYFGVLALGLHPNPLKTFLV